METDMELTLKERNEHAWNHVYQLSYAHQAASDMVTLLETGWTQDIAAETADGYPCSPMSLRACSWCLTGAMDRALAETKWTGDPNAETAESVLRERLVFDVGYFHGDRIADEEDRGNELTSFNDCVVTNQADVLGIVRGVRDQLLKEKEMAADEGRRLDLQLYGKP